MKTRNIKRFVFFLGLFILTKSAFPQGQPKQGVFYAVTGKELKDTSWLFGTYHLINESFLTNNTNVLSAYSNSKAVVVEIVQDSTEMAAAQSQTMLQNKQLSGLLPEEFRDSLDKEFKASFGQGISGFDRFKPMLVMLTYSMVNLMKDNQAILKRYTGLPLDAFFAKTGKDQGKNVVALETIGQQMDLLFNSLSDEEQAQALRQYFWFRERNRKLGNDLLAAYLENDLEKIQQVYRLSIATSGSMDNLVTARNNNWMKVLPSLLSKQPSFVAVGALHLAGPDGLVEQLRQAGYTVTAQNLQ